MNTGWLIALALVNTQASPAKPEPVALRLTAAAEVVPSLRYRLLPELREQTPGNAMTAYYRAFSPEWQAYRKTPAKFEKDCEEVMAMPVEKLKDSAAAKELQWLRTSPLLAEIDRAARRSYCDWELNDRIRQDGFKLLLPDLQEFRSFARLLVIRTRLEMAAGRYDAAARSLATGYAMARHVAEGPTLIHGLVALAIAGTMNKQAEAWIATPGSPNLYWALTDLPQPFIDLRKCIQGERLWMDSLMPTLRERLQDPALPPLSADEMRQIVGKFSKAVGIASETDETGAFGLVFAAVKYPAAKKFLAANGWTAAQVDAMPVLQAVCLHEMFEFDRLFDEAVRGAGLPYGQAYAAAQASEKRLLGGSRVGFVGGAFFARQLVPAVSRTIQARMRTDRQIAALRTLEAVRLDAALHDGVMTRKLDAITAVPLPLDPGTGQAMPFTSDGRSATLHATPLSGEPPTHAIRYTIAFAPLP